MVANNGGPGLGDLGLCIQLCDCNADCKTPGLVCSDFGTGPSAATIKSYLKRQGVCANPKGFQDAALDPGIPSCSAADAGIGGTGGLIDASAD